MRGALFGVLLLGGVAAAQAPAPEGQPAALSIDDAIRVAEARSEAVVIARAGLSRADAEVMRARSEWFPQINGSVGYDRTLINEFQAVIDAAPPGEQGAIGLLFGPNQWRAAVSVSQNLFAGGRTLARQELASATRRTAVVGIQSARAQAVLETVQAYYDAVLADMLLTIAESNFRQAEATYRQTKLARERGTKPEFDLLRATVALENQRPVVLQRKMDRQTAQLRLKQILDLPLEKEVALTSSLAENLPDLAPLTREVSGAPEQPAKVARVTVLQAQEAVVMREAAKKIAWSQHLPQVNVTSSYGFIARPLDFFPTTTFPGNFNDTWTLGVSLQIPIFSGFRITGDVDSATADLVEAQARLRQTEELVQLDTRTAEQQIQTAEASWQASSGVVEQARKAYEIAQIRYSEGISTQLELADAQLLFEQAQANRARAARDLQVARVRVALLPLLPATPALGGFAGAPSGMDPTAAGGASPSTSTSTPAAGGAQQGAPLGAPTGAF